MNILLIGGPKFVGRALIDEALAAGHEPPSPFPVGMSRKREATLLLAHGER